MASSGWIRVAAGIRLVASAAAKQASHEATSVAARTAQHGVDLAANLRNVGGVMQQQPTATTPQPPNNNNESHNPPTVNGHQAASLNPESESNNSDDDPMLASTTATHHNVHSEQEPPAPKPPPINPLFHAPKAESVTPLVEPEPQIEDSPVKSPPEPPESRMTNNQENNDPDDNEPPHTDYQRLQEGKAVPSTRVGRAMGFASLGIGLTVGALGEGLGRLTGTSSSGSNIVMNDSNADRLAASLCRMRGAALKMGQMLSIQDESLLPPELTRALKQVRQGADAMPDYQLQAQLKAQLGDKQQEPKFVSFDKLPFAAASVGQCHRAKIVIDDQNQNQQPKDVVVKVQYPGVGQSIESDLKNLAMLVQWTGAAPKGLFLDNVIRVGTEELKVECDYLREAAAQERMKQLVEADPILVQNRFVVPEVFHHLTTEQVITTAFCPGGTIDKVSHLDQNERNRIARTILYLTIQELFVWRFMQTDPNWGNFLYDVGTQTTSLIDFGATREYSKEFVDGYLRIVWASSNKDEDRLMAQSYKMGFLTGEENEIMLHAHKQSGYTVGEPFRTHEPFDFRGSQLSTRMGQHTSAFMKHRLTPPPNEVYTLHRKLAGAFMLCIKLGAVIRCRDLLENVISNHVFEDGLDPPALQQGMQPTSQ